MGPRSAKQETAQGLDDGEKTWEWWRCQVKSIQAALIPAINGDLDCKSIPSCGHFVRAEQQDPKKSS